MHSTPSGFETFNRFVRSFSGAFKPNCVFRLFCEGGNFSPDETIPLRKKLEKVSQRVDNAEGIVMKDLEGMESKRIETATDFVNKVEEKWENILI